MVLYTKALRKYGALYKGSKNLMVFYGALYKVCYVCHKGSHKEAKREKKKSCAGVGFNYLSSCCR